jgi:deazaflavin-dependent oxidoreductase (nitroreductase family)
MAKPPRAAKQFNKVAVRLAGRRILPPWALLRHRGRMSGTEYAIPVAVIPTDASFVIALPWGRETDWVRNVRAADGCTIRWKGVDYDCTDPTFVGPEVAAAAAHGLTRRVVRRGTFPHGFIQLSRRVAAQPFDVNRRG